MGTSSQQALTFRRLSPLPVLVCLLTIGLTLVGRPRASVADTESLTVEELLSYTITELNEKLQKIVGENDSLSRKNAALRKRILQLRIERSRLEEQKLDGLEQSLQRTDIADLEVKEYFTSDEYTGKIRDRQARLEGYQKRMSGMLADELERKEKLRVEIEDLKAGILELKGKQKMGKRATPSAGFLEERQALKEKILETDNDFRRSEQLVKGTEARLGALTKQKETLAIRSRQLNRDKKALGAELDQLLEAESLIVTKQQDKQTRQESLARQAEAEVEDLKTYRGELTSSLQSLRVLNQKIVEQYNEQKQNQAGSFKILAQEKQFLAAQVSVWQERLRLSGQTPQDHIEEMGDSESAQVQTRRAGLESEKQSLAQEIRQSRSEQREARERKADIKGEIARLQSRKEVLLAKSRKGSPGADAKEIKNLRVALAAQADDNQKLERQEKILKKNVDRLQKEVGLLILNRNDLTSRNKNLQEGLTFLNTQRDQLVLALSQKQKQGETGPQGIRQEIEDLQVRSTLLESSLAVIKSRYDSQDWESQEFLGSEQKELEGYLALLQKENSKLKERVLSLTVAVERLESGKSAPPEE